MTKIHLTARALNDLEEVYGYSLDRWGEETAVKYIKSFEDAFLMLQQAPGLLKINDKISIHFSVYNVRKHFLICDFIDDTIYVLTIQHVSINLLEKLSEWHPSLIEEVELMRGRLLGNKHD